MKYLVEAENNDNIIKMENVGDYLNHVVIPSYEELLKMEQAGKLSGGLVAGERAGAFVIDAESNEDLGGILRKLPFWGMVEWKITPLQSFESALEQDGAIAKAISGDD